MNGSKIEEISFANGKLYKETRLTNHGEVVSERKEEGCLSYYKHSDSNFMDPIFSLFSVKKYEDGKTRLKYYRPSRELYRVISGEELDKGADLSEYDLSPFVSLWVGVATYKDDDINSEVFFAVDTDKELENISKYYSLQFPLPENESLDNDPREWHSKDFAIAVDKFGVECDSQYMTNFKLGSIKFENKQPTLLKMYKSNYKDKNYANNI